jgi:DnaK suppressor protein
VNKAELEKIKASLIARKEELETELDRLSKEGGVEEDTQDEGDMAAAATMESLRTSLQDSEQEEYQRVVQALRAIEQGTYGICRDCGGEISEKRLKFYPNASRCLACQEAAEGM